MAFATYVSIRPNRSTAAATSRSTCPRSLTSVSSARSTVASSSASRVLAPITTRAPRRFARSAIARPRPYEPPPTTTTCSERGFLRATPPSSFPRPPLQTRYPDAMPNVGPWEIVLLLLLALLLFGAKRLPEIGRSMGKGMREFKDSLGGKDDDDEPAELPMQTPDATVVQTTDAPVATRERDTV